MCLNFGTTKEKPEFHSKRSWDNIFNCPVNWFCVKKYYPFSLGVNSSLMPLSVLTPGSGGPLRTLQDSTPLCGHLCTAFLYISIIIYREFCILKSNVRTVGC